ncbi:MAG: hypothetical protein F9K31_02520 [Dokdonella sp.]|nr:MAG: hypothetical protein F9K31_02520 [Dokdonella sp.]
MSLAAVRAAIVARLSAVADIGVVHDRERNAADLARLKALYWSAPHAQLRGWFVRRIATSETGNVQGRTVEQARWRIVGVMGVDDAAASELAFDALVEAIRNAFAQDETLSGTVDQCTDPDGGGASCVQLDDAGIVMFAGVLCHACKLSLTTVRYLERSP